MTEFEVEMDTSCLCSLNACMKTDALLGLWLVSQWFLSKHKNLISVPQTHGKNKACHNDTLCSLRNGETETDRALVLTDCAV